MTYIAYQISPIFPTHSLTYLRIVLITSELYDEIFFQPNVYVDEFKNRRNQTVTKIVLFCQNL